MYSLNRATILGNATRDPELRQTAGGQTVCTFSLATNRSWTTPDGQRREEADFHNMVAWGKLAEICGQYITKGKKVYAEGRLQTREWVSQDGQKRYRTEIIIENMIILDKPSGTGGQAFGTPRPAAPTFSATPAAPMADIPASNPADEIRVDEIPF